MQMMLCTSAYLLDVTLVFFENGHGDYVYVNARCNNCSRSNLEANIENTPPEVGPFHWYREPDLNRHELMLTGF